MLSESYPDIPTLIVVETGETVSFSQLDRRSCQGAWVLWNEGLAVGVGFTIGKHPEPPARESRAGLPMRQHEAVEQLVLRLALSPFFIDIHAAN